MKIETRISELEQLAYKASTDYEQLPDDGSEFPNFTPMKRLKLSFKNLACSAEQMAETLKRIHETGTIA